MYLVMKKLFLTILIILSILSLTACQDKSIDNTIGFKEKDGKKTYMKEPGVYPKDEVLTIEGDDYYFDENAYMTTDSWHDDMYFNEYGKAVTYGKTPDNKFVKNKKMVKSSFVNDEDIYYYYKENGEMAKSEWIEDKENNKIKYYAQADGQIAKKEIVDINDSKYYFKDNRELAISEWIEDKENDKTKWFYAKDDGQLAKNEILNISNSKYYFKDSGEMLRNSWFNKMTMYSGNDGVILKNTYTPDGFYVGEDGIKTEDPKNLELKEAVEPLGKEVAGVVIEKLKTNDKLDLSNIENIELKLKNIAIKSNMDLNESYKLASAIEKASIDSNKSVNDILEMTDQIFDVYDKLNISLGGIVGLASDFVDAEMSLADGDLISCIVAILNNDIINNSDNLTEWANALGYDVEVLKTTWTDDSPQVIAIMLKLLSGNPALIGDVLLDTLKLCGLEDVIKQELREKLKYIVINLPKVIEAIKGVWDTGIPYGVDTEAFFKYLDENSEKFANTFKDAFVKVDEYFDSLEPVTLDNNNSSDAVNIQKSDVTISNILDYSNIKVGDHITFGKYEQDANGFNGMEQIEWRVLDIDGDKALLISKYILDCKTYNNVSTCQAETSWETCTLRNWLNNNFYNKAFTNEEKQKINTSIIKNQGVSIDSNDCLMSIEYDKCIWDSNNDTTDNVFILDYYEISNYLPSCEEKYAQGTSYAITQNVSDFHDNYGSWFIRIPKINKNSDGIYENRINKSSVLIVSIPKYKQYSPNAFDLAADVTSIWGVRPALWIKYK